MPRSKKRKKHGKKVGNGAGKNQALAGRLADRESEVTLQDLINMVAYQEYEALGLYDKGEDVDIHAPEEPEKAVPLTVENADGTKRQVGTATPIPGREGYVSIHIDDAELRQELDVARGDASIDFEDPNTQAVIKAASKINEENA